MTQAPAMRPTGEPIDVVLDRATGPRRAEADELLALHAEVSGADPVVWAGRIIGFGEHEYRYASGHGGLAPLLAFAPGAARHTVYLVDDFADRWPDLMARLGKHRASKACLYLTRLTDVDVGVLRQLLGRSRDATAASAR
ncbi:hypothetical protein FHW23_001599 [Curtobacterium pusillum]|uniref:YdhG-like domain-containing protein n=1 Tax=Curtobacterium pusillum TaxID=69373 RepID=A0AAW3T714_9MICO|nr:DUF1801 domain-containing protein [Curtobacterium pusillum]MBA8990353.1 hypothetical protein [Curtobacterium pusillum]